MRITRDEVHAIKSTAADVFGADAVVRLVGSRTRDDARGGDIDLHIVTSDRSRATLSNEMRFSLALQDLIGEQQIDVVTIARDGPFRATDRIAFVEGIVL